MMKLDTNKILVVKPKVNLPKIYTFWLCVQKS